MTELPEPLTPPDCDLRGMPYMAFDIVRLFDSDFYALSTGDEFKAGWTLWAKAFLQVPAGSLPDDDRILEHLSGSKRWKQVREVAMRGWFKCSDGRLYHKVVAEKALEAWEIRKVRFARTEAARAARHKTNGGNVPPVTEEATEDETEYVEPPPQSLSQSLLQAPREEKRREEKKKESIPKASPSAAGAAVDPPDARIEVWREGLALLRGLTGKPDGASRSFLGRLLKTLGDDCGFAMSVLHQAADLRPIDPEAWIMKTCLSRASRRETGISARREKILRAGGLWPADGQIIDHEHPPGRFLQ